MFLANIARVARCSGSRSLVRSTHRSRFNLQPAVFDNGYLLDRENVDEIETNIKQRKGIGDIRLIHELHQRLKTTVDPSNVQRLQAELHHEMSKIPNRTHPAVVGNDAEPKLIEQYNESVKNNERKYFEFADVAKKMNLYRMEKIANYNGHRSYYLTHELAELEQALIRYSVAHLLSQGYKLISVPDILPAPIIEACGMSTHGDRNQVYKLDSGNDENLCLSGTSEMALAGYFSGSRLSSKQLPLKVAAVSRCFRAETSSVHEEKGIYRVHQFTKVEMFSICTPEQSEGMLEEVRATEVALFTGLGIPFKLLDMPPAELGPPAYRKYDIEAWMPARQMYGEISSCSNCTDYQARRLDIKIAAEPRQAERFAHTINGTACAIPRMLIVLLENFQNEDFTISVPEALQQYMNGTKKLTRRKILPELKLAKRIAQEQIC